MATVKMRCARVSQFDSGGVNMREVQLVSVDRNNVPLNPPEETSYANMSATFVGENGADILHDSFVDVAITIGTAPLAADEEGA